MFSTKRIGGDLRQLASSNQHLVSAKPPTKIPRDLTALLTVFENAASSIKKFHLVKRKCYPKTILISTFILWMVPKVGPLICKAHKIWLYIYNIVGISPWKIRRVVAKFKKNSNVPWKRIRFAISAKKEHSVVQIKWKRVKAEQSCSAFWFF